jgi:hypothetical protein
VRLRQVIPGEQTRFGMFGDEVDPSGEFADYYLRLGVQFADGRTATNLRHHRAFEAGRPDPPLLTGTGGGGHDGRVWDHDYWVWGCPRPGRWCLCASGRPVGSGSRGGRSTPAWCWRRPRGPYRSGQRSRPGLGERAMHGKFAPCGSGRAATHSSGAPAGHRVRAARRGPDGLVSPAERTG